MAGVAELAVCADVADDGTKQWLVDHVDCVFGFPSLVRFSWATCRPLMEATCAAVYW